jgi:hypothetical protein
MLTNSWRNNEEQTRFHVNKTHDFFGIVQLDV